MGQQRVFDVSLAAIGIDAVHRIGGGVFVAALAFVRKRVHVQEAPRGRIVVARPQIIQAEVRVELFAAIEIVVRRCAGLVDRVAEGVVLVGVGHGYVSGQIRQLPDAAHAVVLIEAGCPRAVDGLGLADALEAVGITPRDCAVDRLFHHLRQPGRVHIVLHKILRGHAIHRLGNPVAEGIVDSGSPFRRFRAVCLKLLLHNREVKSVLDHHCRANLVSKWSFATISFDTPLNRIPD